MTVSKQPVVVVVTYLRWDCRDDVEKVWDSGTGEWTLWHARAKSTRSTGE
jgi:hypothetical protein